MKRLIFFVIILSSCYSKISNNNILNNSIWKYCDDGSGHISDILVFDKEHLYTKNDSIFFYNSDTLLGIVDTISFHYGERRLIVKDKNGNIGTYCEQ